MDVMLFSGTNRRQLLGLFRQLQRGGGGHLRRPYVRIVRGRDVAIRSLERYAVETHVDGDTVLETPINCRAMTETVTVLTPPSVQSPKSKVQRSGQRLLFRLWTLDFGLWTLFPSRLDRALDVGDLARRGSTTGIRSRWA